MQQSTLSPITNGKFICRQYFDFGKILQARILKMPVVANDAICRSSDCAVNKFVIVRVLFDDLETIERLHFLDKWMHRKKLNHVFRYFCAVFTSQNLSVFQNYFCRDAHSQFTIDDAVKNPAIRRSQANYGYQHIGVNDYP